MASRRDELNAYTFAKRRLVAAFLQPSPAGSDEGAPKPLRAIVPSLVAGALLLAVFGALGMFRPVAPRGWAEPGAKVVVGKDSTTRYVVLTTGTGLRRETLLHPVLNLASARLLLSSGRFGVVRVSDEVLDAGSLPRGPVLGIPYAPDRLPDARDAARAKRWAVCEQPGGGAGSQVQRGVFLLAGRDHHRTDGPQRLRGGQTLYVKGRNQDRYLVDASGTKYLLRGSEGDHLSLALVGLGHKPQPVSDGWLATLRDGSPVDFPEFGFPVGADAGIGGELTPGQDRVGMVLRAQTGSGPQHYVVLPGKVRPVSAFTAWLLINSPQADALDMGGMASTVDAPSLSPEWQFFGAGYRWPAQRISQVNGSGGGARDTVCAVLRTVDGKGGGTLSTWAGSGYPVKISPGGSSTYVTPGSGLLYTRAQGEGTKQDGSLFLVTDTGLRYAVQANDASDAARSGDRVRDGFRRDVSDAQIRLGYGEVVPHQVPAAWSDFLSSGPTLSTRAARQPQGL